MKGLILGGATFVGYSLKNKLRKKYSNIEIITLDLIRPSYHFYKKPGDEYIDLRDLQNQSITRGKIDFIVINFFDLLDPEAFTINSNNNNLLFNSINIILDFLRENKSKLIIILNKHHYNNPNNNYQSIYNNFTDFYISYLKIKMNVEKIDMKIFLLPNVYGQKEASRSIIKTVVSKVQLQEELVLAKTKRDFLYVDDVVSHLTIDMFKSNLPSIIEYYSGEEYTLLNIYQNITDILDTQTDVSLIAPNYVLKNMSFQDVYHKRIPARLARNLNKYINKED